jgi:hypothetical protein
MTLLSRDFETVGTGLNFFVRCCTSLFLLGRAGCLVLPFLYLFVPGMRCLDHNLHHSPD